MRARQVDVLVVTWLAGGATLGALGIARELASRGHRVRVLAPARFEETIHAFGGEHVRHPSEAEFDVLRGRAVDDQVEFIQEMFFGPLLADATRATIEEQRPDLVVVDQFLLTSIVAVHAAEVPLVVFSHISHFGSHVDPDDPRADQPWGWRWEWAQVNAQRIAHGMPERELQQAPVGHVEMVEAVRTIVALPAELNSWQDPPPNVVHVGPVDSGLPPSSPTSDTGDDDGRPLVVVTMGTTYMHQENLLVRVVDALRPLGVRVLVLTGHELDPAELDCAGPDVRVESYVPHGEVLPHASLVITHAGMGSVLAAYRYGVPAICIPLGRDQHGNAAAAAARGAAIVVPADASVEDIRKTAAEALASAELRAAAGMMADILAACPGARGAADAVEEAAASLAT